MLCATCAVRQASKCTSESQEYRSILRPIEIQCSHHSHPHHPHHSLDDDLLCNFPYSIPLLWNGQLAIVNMVRNDSLYTIYPTCFWTRASPHPQRCAQVRIALTLTIECSADTDVQLYVPKGQYWLFDQQDVPHPLQASTLPTSTLQTSTLQTSTLPTSTLPTSTLPTNNNALPTTVVRIPCQAPSQTVGLSGSFSFWWKEHEHDQKQKGCNLF